MARSRGRGRGAQDELGGADDAGDRSTDGNVGADDDHALDEAAVKQRDAGGSGGGRRAQCEDRGRRARDGQDRRTFGDTRARDRLANDEIIEDEEIRDENGRGTRDGGRSVDDEASGTGLDVDRGGTRGGRDATHVNALEGAGREGRDIDRDDRSGTRKVETRVGDSDARDHTAGDRGTCLGRSGTEHAAVSVEVKDWRRRIARAADESQDVSCGQASKRSERAHRLVHRTGRVTELEHAVGISHAEVERGDRVQAIIRARGQAAREDETPVGDGGGTEVGRDGGAAEDEVGRTRLGKAADADAGQAADRTSEREVVRADVERTARGHELEGTRGKVRLRKGVRQLENAAREDEVTRRATDITQRRDAEDAFVDRGLLRRAAPSDVSGGKHEGAAAGLRQVGAGGQRRIDDGSELRRDGRRGRILHRDDVFRRAEAAGAVEGDAGKAGQLDGAGRGRRGVRIEREQDGTRIDAERTTAGDGEIGSGRGVVMQDEGVDAQTRGQAGQVTDERLADIPRRGGRGGGLLLGKRTVLVGQVEDAQGVGNEVIRDERVAHVDF